MKRTVYSDIQLNELTVPLEPYLREFTRHDVNRYKKYESLLDRFLFHHSMYVFNNCQSQTINSARLTSDQLVAMHFCLLPKQIFLYITYETSVKSMWELWHSSPTWRPLFAREPQCPLAHSNVASNHSILTQSSPNLNIRHLTTARASDSSYTCLTMLRVINFCMYVCMYVCNKPTKLISPETKVHTLHFCNNTVEEVTDRRYFMLCYSNQHAQNASCLTQLMTVTDWTETCCKERWRNQWT